MQQVSDTEQRFVGAAEMQKAVLALQGNGSLEELAGRILSAQGQARLLPELTLGLLHKLNNVMTSIYFTAEACEADVEPGHPVAETLAELTRSVQEAQQLISQTSEVNLTLGNAEPEYHDLNALVQRELFLLKMLLPKAAVVEVECLAKTAFVRMSIADFRRVLFSLASNAASAASEHPQMVLKIAEATDLNAEEYAPELLQGGEEMVALIFRDNGQGIAPEIAAEAFAPFVTTRPDRLGLGLFQAQQIAQRNGGQLVIRRCVPTGAEVAWLMPRITE